LYKNTSFSAYLSLKDLGMIVDMGQDVAAQTLYDLKAADYAAILHAFPLSAKGEFLAYMLIFQSRNDHKNLEQVYVAMKMFDDEFRGKIAEEFLVSEILPDA
jgi:hypothetical protein